MQMHTQITAIRAARKSEFQHPPGFLKLEGNKAKLKMSPLLPALPRPEGRITKVQTPQRPQTDCPSPVRALCTSPSSFFNLSEEQWECPVMTLTCPSVWRRWERSFCERFLFSSRVIICIPEHLIIFEGFEVCVVWLWWNSGDQGCRGERIIYIETAATNTMSHKLTSLSWAAFKGLWIGRHSVRRRPARSDATGAALTSTILIITEDTQGRIDRAAMVISPQLPRSSEVAAYFSNHFIHRFSTSCQTAAKID